MDTELRFISCLLGSNKHDQDELWTRQLPTTMFPLREKEIFWVMRFREKHGRFPSKRAFELKFDEELTQVEDPLSETLEPIVTQAAYAQLKDIVDSTTEMFNEKKDAADILDTFKSKANALQNLGTSSYVDERLDDTMIAQRRYKTMLASRNVKGAFIDSPWPRLNRLLNFVRPGEVVVIAARPSLGKTWLTLHWMNHLAKQGVDTLIVSKEMPTPQIADRITALRFGLDWENYRALCLTIEQQVDWKIAARKAAKIPYPMLVSGEETLEGTGIEQVYSKIQTTKPRVVAIDGAYLLSVKGLSKNATDTEKFGAISRAAKRIAKVTNTAIFVVIQMNRGAETKGGVAKGGMTTIYGADAWGQDADYVIEIAGERGADERAVCVHKSRETNIGDIFVNFKLSPLPDFSEKASLSSGSASKSTFKPLK